MKYIRTQFTIFEVVDETAVIYRVRAKGNPHNFYSKSKCKTDVVKSADTIEELCDEFIVVSDNCERPIISALPFNELQLYAKGRTKYAACYGAIWTDKGLIYVAKMNDKGELELL